MFVEAKRNAVIYGDHKRFSQMKRRSKKEKIIEKIILGRRNTRAPSWPQIKKIKIHKIWRLMKRGVNQ